jgi:hypothetical protein
MSGGYFNYQQDRLDDMATTIRELIDRHTRKAIDDDDSDFRFSAATVAKFEEAVSALNRAEVYVQRIDWLVSGDDGEDTFHAQLAKDLAALTVDK